MIDSTAFIDALTLSGGYNSKMVVIGTTLLGISAGIVGCFTLLRKRALVGDAIAHSALPGIALAFIFAYSFGLDEKNLFTLLSGAALSGLVGLALLHFITTQTRLGEEAATGAVLSVLFSIGVVLLSYIQNLGTGREGGLQHFIFGQTAALGLRDAQITAMVSLLVLVVVSLLFKEFRAVCFDRDFSRLQGMHVEAIDIAMLLLLMTVTIIGLQSVGMLLVISLLITPAATARFWSDSLRMNVGAAALFGGLSGYLGSIASAMFPHAPAGAVIILICGGIFVFSLIVSPKKGLLAVALKRFRLSVNVTNDHLLREACERAEKLNADHAEELVLDLRQLRSYRFGSRAARFISLLELRANSMLKLAGPRKIKLTARGHERARQLLKRHLLWERYLYRFGALPESHLDYSADLAEHVISAEVEKRLEESLKEEARG